MDAFILFVLMFFSFLALCHLLLLLGILEELRMLRRHMEKEDTLDYND